MYSLSQSVKIQRKMVQYTQWRLPLVWTNTFFNSVSKYQRWVFFSFFFSLIRLLCNSQFPLNLLPSLLNRNEGFPQKITSHFYVLGSLLLRLVVHLSAYQTGGWPAFLPSSSVKHRQVIDMQMYQPRVWDPGWGWIFWYKGLNCTFHLNIHSRGEEISMRKKNLENVQQLSNYMFWYKMTSWSRTSQITLVWLSERYRRHDCKW